MSSWLREISPRLYHRVSCRLVSPAEIHAEDLHRSAGLTQLAIAGPRLVCKRCPIPGNPFELGLMSLFIGISDTK